jgi:hypothetical protein
MVPKNHKIIGIEACLPKLREAFPNENLGYLLLGNWLTDVSQGVAPVDYAANMTDARNKGVDDKNKESWIFRYLVPDIAIHWRANKLIRELLGNPPPVNSAMAQWFKNVAYVAGWVEFCSPEGPSKNLVHLGAGPISFDEYDRIFHGKKVGGSISRFSQYFPHEHFDRWPIDRKGFSDSKKVYKFIEDHILNIAEILTLVERDLVKFMNAQGEPDPIKKSRSDLLAEFGYALHTAEDYWAHTNYVDFAMRSINDIPKDPDLLRRHQRRLWRDLKPRIKDEEPSGEGKEKKDETHVVGGFFDGMDTRFSLTQLYKGFLTSLESHPNRKPHKWTCGARDCGGHMRRDHVCPSGTWYCRRVDPPCPGHEKPEDSCPDKENHKWNCGAKGCQGIHSRKKHTCPQGTWKCGRVDRPCPGEHNKPEDKCDDPLALLDWREAKTKKEREQYELALSATQTRMNMPQKVRDAELKFIKIDWQLIDDWNPKCVSWLLQKMLGEGKVYASKTFANGERYSERLGCHTLIAKDDDTKQPGFEHAMNLAKFVDKYIVDTIIRSASYKSRFSGRTGENKKCELKDYVDWLELIQYFMGHPDEARQFKQIIGPRSKRKKIQSTWWKSVMKYGGKEHGHKLKFITVEEMNKRAKLETRKRLEEDHNSMIGIENAKYEKEFNAGDGVITESPKDKPFVLNRKGDSHKYQQDDMDRGSVRLECLKGEVQIDLSAAVWSEFKHISTAKVSQGNIWGGDFKELSSVYDQDNRAVVTALSDGAEYKFAMVSYDR